jgi:hypothetical protein
MLPFLSQCRIDKPCRYAHRRLLFTRLDSILPLYSASSKMAAFPPYSFVILICRVCIIEISDMVIIEHLSRLHVIGGGEGAKKRGGRGKEGASQRKMPS